MFELFVIGPVAPRGLGLIRRCIDCRASRDANAPACGGFGEGCLAAAQRPPEFREACAAPRY